MDGRSRCWPRGGGSGPVGFPCSAAGLDCDERNIHSGWDAMSESLYRRLLGLQPQGAPMAEELRRAPMSGPRQAFTDARRPAVPGLQPPAERNGQSQADFYMPGPTVTATAPLPQYQDGPGAGHMGRPNPMGSMPDGPIPEEPGVAGRSPYARPAAPRVPLAMGQPPMPGGGADELNAMVMAILNGQGGDSEQERRLREAMQMASGPQQGSLY